MESWRSKRKHHPTRTEERYIREKRRSIIVSDRLQSFAPVVKSILPSKADEAKRREARRKSLGMF